MATVWLIEFQSVCLYFRATIKGTQTLSSRSLKWGGGTGSPVKMTCPQSPGHRLGSDTFGKGQGEQGLGRSQSYLWALTVGSMLRNDVHALRRMDKAWRACNLALGRSCFTSVSIFPIVHQFSEDMKCWCVSWLKQAQVVVGSIFFPWGLWRNSWGLSAVWDHAWTPKGFLSLSVFSRKRLLRAMPKD